MPPTRVLRLFVAVSCSAALAAHALAAAPATVLLQPDANGRMQPRFLGEGGAARFIQDGRGLAAEAVDPDGSARFIVRLASAEASGFAAAVRARSASAEAFTRTLAHAWPARAGRPGREGVRVLRTFDRLESACVVEAPADFATALAALPGVRAVSRDAHVEGFASPSQVQVRADRVQNELGGRGRGVRVGVLDTGLDYTHPAFGGAMGPGQRVAGGWDFVNQDADPLDDNGHGTHVAGILAASGGGLVGMAPEATLYIYKVLDARGSGFFSHVIAALERAADPDGDPATADALDVVNLSLGGFTNDPDDPLSEAVDALDALGTLVVVAAGNNGAMYTIATPGIARGALTVGSVSATDVLSRFSSRGPTSDLRSKPDVLAPGEDIVSAWLGGGSQALSGTSMATPMVAGAAAQLRGLHPDWDAARLRAALVGTARDLRMASYEQGAGRLEVWDAATATWFVERPVLSLGRVQPRHAAAFSETLRVVSTAALALDVTAALAMSPARDGVTLRVAPAVLRLEPGVPAEVVVSADFAADRFLARTPPFVTDGALVLRAGAQQRRIPVSVYDCLRFAARVGLSPAYGMLVDRDRPWPSAGVFAPVWYVPPGEYEVAAFGVYQNEPFVSAGPIALERDTLVSIPTGTGAALLQWDLRDERGAAHRPEKLQARLVHRSGAALGLYGFPLETLTFLPAASDRFHVEWGAADVTGPVRRDFAGSVTGPFVSQTITNRPQELRRQLERLRPTAGDTVQAYEVRLFPDADSSFFGLYTLDDRLPSTVAPFEIERWIAPSPERRHTRLGRIMQLVHASFARTFTGPFLAGTSPTWGLDLADTTTLLPYLAVGPRLASLMPEVLTVGSGHRVFRGLMHMGSGTAGFTSFRRGLFVDAFGGELAGEDAVWTLQPPGAPADTDTLHALRELTGGSAFTRSCPGGAPATLSLRANAQVAGLPSTTTASFTRDANGEVSFAPGPEFFAVLAEGSPAEQVEFGSVRDPHVEWAWANRWSHGTLRLEYRTGSGAWLPLRVERTSDEGYRAELVPVAGAVSLRLRVADPMLSPGEFVMEVAPAFVGVVRNADHAVLLAASAAAGEAHLDWRLEPGAARWRVERAGRDGLWHDIGAALAGADGVARFVDRGLAPGSRWSYRLAGAAQVVTLDLPAGGEGFALAPLANPMSGEPLLSLQLAVSEPLRLALYDVQGRLVHERTLTGLAPGRHVVPLAPGQPLAAGLYFLRATRAAGAVTRRFTLLR